MATLDVQRLQYEAKLKALLEALSGGITQTSGDTILPARLSIINYVKAKLDELVPQGEGLTFKLSSEPNISDPYDLLINAHLDEATKDVLLSAPLSILVPVKSDKTTGTPFSEGAQQGYIDLPSDFLRLSMFKMADWQRTLTDAITPADPKYKLQTNAYLRGGVVKPVAVLNWRDNAGTITKTLEYYSVDTVHTIEKLLFIEEKTAEDFVSANPNLLPSLAWMCAGKIMQIIGLMDHAKMAMEQVKLSYVNL